MTNTETVFRLELRIDNIVGTSHVWIFDFGKIAIGSKKLRRLLAKTFNEAKQFIDEDIDKKEQPKRLVDVK